MSSTLSFARIIKALATLAGKRGIKWSSGRAVFPPPVERCDLLRGKISLQKVLFNFVNVIYVAKLDLNSKAFVLSLSTSLQV